MVFAMTLEPDAAKHDHLVIAFDLLEGLLQDLDRVLTITREELLERACHARRRLAQAIPLGIIARPPDDGPDRRLDLGSTGLLDLRLRRSCTIQRMHIWSHWDAFPRRFSQRTFNPLDVASPERFPKKATPSARPSPCRWPCRSPSGRRISPAARRSPCPCLSCRRRRSRRLRLRSRPSPRRPTSASADRPR